METALDERHAIGANNPPEPDPFEAHRVNIEGLYDEAKLWADGAEIENQAQADDVDLLINMIKDAIDAAKASEVAATKPLQDQVRVIQQRYWPLIGDTSTVKGLAVKAKTALLAVKTKWGNKVRVEQELEAKRLRDEAAKKAVEAQAALRDAPDDLGTVETAETLIRDAQATLRAATQAEKPTVKGMRDNWIICGFQPVTEADGKVTDGETALLRHMWRVNKPGLVEAALKLAETDVRSGKRTIPGLLIENHRRAV